MNISFENPDKVNGLLTITVEESDFQDSVEKTLKDYRKKANIPGFRRVRLLWVSSSASSVHLYATTLLTSS